MFGAEAVVHGLGIDLVNIGRLREFVARRGEDAIDRLLTETERLAVRGSRGLIWSSLAGRIAGKEATRKLLGSRGEVARWTEIEIYHGLHGEPYLRLVGGTWQAAQRQGFNSVLVSISHEKDAAIAVVLGSSAWTAAANPWRAQ